MTTFKVGDVVMLKGYPGVPMVVHSVTADACRATWLDTKNRFRTAGFANEVLMLHPVKP